MKLIRKITRDSIFYIQELKDYEIFKHQLSLIQIKKIGNERIEKYTNYKENFTYFYDENGNIKEVQIFSQDESENK